MGVESGGRLTNQEGGPPRKKNWDSSQVLRMFFPLPAWTYVDVFLRSVALAEAANMLRIRPPPRLSPSGFVPRSKSGAVTLLTIQHSDLVQSPALKLKPMKLFQLVGQVDP